MNENMRLRLYYGPVLVGDILEPFCDQGTWFGKFRPAISSEAGDTERRLMGFIAFCGEWNERAKGDRPRDASEFDAFGDVIGSGLWQTRASDGADTPIEDAPVFFENDEVTWTSASREV